jgi:hypothetical protein
VLSENHTMEADFSEALIRTAGGKLWVEHYDENFCHSKSFKIYVIWSYFDCQWLIQG